jgi:hypothetical protein
MARIAARSTMDANAAVGLPRPFGRWRHAPAASSIDVGAPRRGHAARFPNHHRRIAMSHLLDPDHLANDADYAAALGELEDLMLADPDTPAGRRFDELVHLIEDFEARHWPAEIPRTPEAREAPALYGMA